ncbi:protein TWIN LOV 1 isoform X2 [Arabidopsis lyrata subsp. lyrata]|uniref:protein TWIN LOV 1 isoform X2 n=1 Tax=Arabidopsis lyrata subsp. lyrata TaxID=81972 RepID=UPI000A29DEBE|nr:protein TWIN LOV 1 isoform X2 [Arabidopsis lyrata subsp. lyrata]|eukprot:XP_020881304.1 protein TWIN LOV 1 isoform X2 [Arabidopsis lyrata subsp. lyrata]
MSLTKSSEEDSFNGRYTLWITEALEELPHNFTITDPFISGHPIVFASLGFLKMTGYSREEVIGRNGKVFQGPKTNRRSIMEIREAIREERSVMVSLLNYRKSGSPFWMLFHMSPVFGRDDGKVINFVAVQVPISGQEHRKLGVMSSDHSELVFGSCRREVCFGSFVHQNRASPVECDDEQGLEDWEHCEASESEKLKAVEAVNNVLSILTRYSELSGRLVCGKRYCLRGVDCLSSSLVISLGRIKQSFVLTNPCLPDMPIIYASDAFLTLTGYKRQEVLGQNCRFLSGVDTDSSVLYEIKECILKGQSCTVQILNYRKDKSSFWNLLHISPVRNASGKTAYFVGVQVEASCRNTESKELRPETRQLRVVGAVRFAVMTSLLVTCKYTP